MGDVLSQNEIDSLLQQLNSGEIDPDDVKDSSDKQVKNYDFARPSKFSKEQENFDLEISECVEEIKSDDEGIFILPDYMNFEELPFNGIYSVIIPE